MEHWSLRFVSWNTRGIRYTKERSSKLQLVLDELIKLKADVVFLQETHIGPQSYEALENIKGWRSFFTVHDPRSKGVAILINTQKIKFRYICHDEDYSGGYIVLFCHIHEQLYTLVNVYNHKEDRDMLHRLRNYLSAINTKGVLVVGGDFNTVLDPVLDRRPSADQTYQSSRRSILEDFTESLSLKDVFAFMHPFEEGFTRSQNQSHSRLDMFLMPENTKEDVIECKPHKGIMRESTTGKKRISDHDPLVLDVEVPSLWKNEMPEVASELKESENCGAPDRRAGKINGAEILSAIRSLPDSQPQTSDEFSVSYYKKNDLAMTERLKISYNTMLKSKDVPEHFSDNCFNVEYLIFAQILAKRLNVFLRSSFGKGKSVAHGHRIRVNFAEYPQKFKMCFLQKCLLSLEDVTPSPPMDFDILENLLPKDSTEKYRQLRQGCPLTASILIMALKQLENEIMRKNPGNTSVSVCYSRKYLVICTDEQKTGETVTEMVTGIEKHSGLTLQITQLQG